MTFGKLNQAHKLCVLVHRRGSGAKPGTGNSETSPGSDQHSRIIVFLSKLQINKQSIWQSFTERHLDTQFMVQLRAVVCVYVCVCMCKMGLSPGGSSETLHGCPIKSLSESLQGTNPLQQAALTHTQTHTLFSPSSCQSILIMDKCSVAGLWRACIIVRAPWWRLMSHQSSENRSSVSCAELNTKTRNDSR